MTPEEKITAAQDLLAAAQAELVELHSGAHGVVRGHVAQKIWSIIGMCEPASGYFSQAGQDRYVDEVLMDRKRNGIFVDVGGYDGVTGSNTLFFEVFRGWSGLLIEPAPNPVQQARQVRRCKCLDYGIAGAPGELMFMQVLSGYVQMSGFLEFYDTALLGQVRDNVIHRERVIPVETRALAHVLTDHSLFHIDYLSLDVEGAELDILRTFPFDRFDITAWSIENNTADPELARLMAANGYELLEHVGVDEIYARPTG